MLELLKFLSLPKTSITFHLFLKISLVLLPFKERCLTYCSRSSTPRHIYCLYACPTAILSGTARPVVLILCSLHLRPLEPPPMSAQCWWEGQSRLHRAAFGVLVKCSPHQHLNLQTVSFLLESCLLQHSTGSPPGT